MLCTPNMYVQQCTCIDIPNCKAFTKHEFIYAKSRTKNYLQYIRFKKYAIKL